MHGKFDCLELGCSKEWILHNFPDPDDWGTRPRFEEATLWRYGNLELHFNGDILSMIFTGYIQDLVGGESLRLDKWIFAGVPAPTLERVAHQLNLDGVD